MWDGMKSVNLWRNHEPDELKELTICHRAVTEVPYSNPTTHRVPDLEIIGTVLPGLVWGTRSRQSELVGQFGSIPLGGLLASWQMSTSLRLDCSVC